MIVIDKTMWPCILDGINVSRSDKLQLCMHALQRCSPGWDTAKTPVDFRGFGASYCVGEPWQGMQEKDQASIPFKHLSIFHSPCIWRKMQNLQAAAIGACDKEEFLY